MKKLLLPVAVFMLLFINASGQQSLGDETAYKIKREAFSKSQMESLMRYTTDFMGPRLAGSKLMTRSEELAVKKLKELGLENVQVDAVAPFSKGGWDNQKTYVAMTAPYYCNFYGISKAWSGSTKGLVSGEIVVIEAATQEELKKYKGKLAGKIVLMPSLFEYSLSLEPLASRYTQEQLAELETDPRSSASPRRAFRGASGADLTKAILNLLLEENPAVIVSGRGNFNIPTVGSAPYKQGEKEPVAEIILPPEAHARMIRLVQEGVPVSMEIEIKNEFSKGNGICNVMGEIPGIDPKLKNEVVLVGAHLDSWYGGTGAADNASGVAVMMEAMRIIKTLGISPKRTIRIALWGGEEQGMIGSRGYVSKYLYDREKKEKRAAYDQLALYLNMDNGSGRFRGIYLEENDMALPFFQVWGKAFESLGFTTLTLRRSGGTDHQSFQSIGLPGFQFIQDDLDYNRTYHTPLDTYERLSPADLKYNAAVVAWVALCAAMDTQKIQPEIF